MLEQQLAEALSQVALPPDWQARIMYLLKEPPTDSNRIERERLTKRIERLRFQHLCGAIDDETFRKEFRCLRHQLDAMPEAATETLESYRNPVDLLRSIGSILGHPTVQERPDAMRQFQRFCEIAFSRVEVDGTALSSIEPRPRYAELFAVALSQKTQRNSSPSGLGNGAVERT